VLWARILRACDASTTARRVLDLVVRGRLALPGGRLYDGEVGVRDGRIEAIGRAGELRAEAELEAPAGALVLPGHVDTHVHTRSEPTEGITAATRAAAAGGATTVVDMPYDDPEPITTVDAFRAKAAAVEREAVVDVALYATVAPRDGLGEIDGLVDAGAAAFKVSTFDTHPVRFPRIPDDELYLAMQAIARRGSLIAFHAENDEIVRRLSRELADAGREDAMTHAEARPPVTETEAAGRALELALATGARTHLCHLTLDRSFTLVARARADGADATAETCTHYLLLDEGELARQGARAKINPPLRPADQVEALWRLVASGGVHHVTSDHVGWLPERKQTGSIWTARSGAPGLELTLPLLYSEGVATRGLPLARLLEVLCERPARRFGLWPRKGALAPGADADLVVLDPEARWHVAEGRLVTAAGWSPYEGRAVTGRIRHVLVRGVEVARDGAIVAEAGHGAFVRPAAP
jgi:allantoinase